MFRILSKEQKNNIFSQKREICEILTEMEVCDGISCNYDNKTINQLFTGMPQRADWVYTFFTSMEGSDGWPTKKEIISDIINQIKFYNNYYSSSQWAVDALALIDRWLLGEVSDREVIALGKVYKNKKPYNSNSDSKNIAMFDAIISALLSIKITKMILSSINNIADAVSLNPEENKNKTEELFAMTERIGISKYINDTIRDQIF